MALNATGAISLGGSTTGQSIAIELSLSATAQISLNDTVVRTLAGVASGAISMNDLRGKSSELDFGTFLLPTSNLNIDAGSFSSGGDLVNIDLNPV